MSLEDLFQFTLNIEEAAINPGKDVESYPRNSKEFKVHVDKTTVHAYEAYGMIIGML
jgi:hypothetical protein